MNATPETALTGVAARDYRAILERNDQRVKGRLESWPKASMRQAAGITASDAAKIRREGQTPPPDSPRTEAIRVDIEKSSAWSLTGKPSEDYRAILERNDQRVKGRLESWPKASMRKAARIHRSNAAKILKKGQPAPPDTPGMVAIKAHIDQLPDFSLSGKPHVDYKALRRIDRDRTEAGADPWSDLSMQKVAEISNQGASSIRKKERPSGGDTERMAAIKKDLAETHHESLSGVANADYRMLRRLNRERIEAGLAPWHDPSMQKVAGIHSTKAANVRQEEPRPTRPDTPVTAAIKGDIASLPERSLSGRPLADYLTILRRDSERIEMGEEGWPDASMQEAAAIDGKAAAKIRAREQAVREDTPRTTEIRDDLIMTSEGWPTGNKRNDYRAALDRNRQRIDGGEEPWYDPSMQRAAEIDTAAASLVRQGRGPARPDSPRTTDIKEELAGRLTGRPTIDYQMIRAHDRQRVAGGAPGWKDPSMRKAARIDPSNASLVRQREPARPPSPRTAAIRTEVADELTGHPPGDYQTILARNEERIAQGEAPWHDRSMRQAAKVGTGTASRIRGRVRSGGLDAAEPGPSRVKAEPSAAASALRAVYQEVVLDMVRTTFQRYVHSADVTGERAVWTLGRDDDIVSGVHHGPMQPDPAMDRVSPFRNPENPQQVHPLYADPSDPSRFAPAVTIQKIEIAAHMTAYLLDLAAYERDKPAGKRRLDMTSEEMRAMIPRLARAVQAELERTGRGDPPEPDVLEVRRVTEQDVEPHERALVGQHGLFVREDTDPEDMPTLSEGRILGLYPGSMLKTDEELGRHMAVYGESAVNRYALDVERSRGADAATYSAIGGANSMPFANTALLANSGAPAYDEDRINALFLPFTVSLRDKDGRPRKETVMAVVGLDNLLDQVLIDYGEAYLSQFAEPEAAMALPTRIKREEE